MKLKGLIPRHVTTTVDGKYRQTVDITAVVELDGSTIRVAVTLDFTIQKLIRFDPPSINPGVVSCRERFTTRVAAMCFSPAAGMRISESSSWRTSVNRSDDGSWLITSELGDGQGCRLHNEPIRVIPVDATGNELPAVLLPVFVDVRDDLTTSPGHLPLGRVAVGTVVEESIRVVSLANRSFEIVSSQGDSDDVAVQRMRDDPATLKIRASIRETGQQLRTATIRVREDDGTVRLLRVEVPYLGFRSHE